jgi:putative toxin-antitoxin system antitoxin component (TIGR02293 family)
MGKAAVSRNTASILLARYEESYKTPVSIFMNAHKGVAAKTLLDLMILFSFGKQTMESIFLMSYKTISNYQQQHKKLDVIASEKVLAMMALYKKGLEIFGSQEEFNKWLSEPAFGLGKQIPIQFLSTMTGIGLIDEELTRIEYGDLA